MIKEAEEIVTLDFNTIYTAEIVYKYNKIAKVLANARNNIWRGSYSSSVNLVHKSDDSWLDIDDILNELEMEEIEIKSKDETKKIFCYSDDEAIEKLESLNFEYDLKNLYDLFDYDFCESEKSLFDYFLNVCGCRDADEIKENSKHIAIQYAKAKIYELYKIKNDFLEDFNPVSVHEINGEYYDYYEIDGYKFHKRKLGVDFDINVIENSIEVKDFYSNDTRNISFSLKDEFAKLGIPNEYIEAGE